MNKIIHTYGDSHATHYGAWDKITIPNLTVSINHFPGKLMYSFGRDSMDVVKNINENDMVCFCFGEIDCRCHINKFEPDWGKTIDDVVENYFINIKKNVEKYKNLTTFVFNIVPPLERELPENFSAEYYNGNPIPALGSDIDRRKYTLYMNDKLKEYCKIYDYIFLNVYDNYVNEKGFISTEFSDGNCHINNPIYVEEFLMNFLK